MILLTLPLCSIGCGADYALDSVSRGVSPRGALRCPTVPMVTYRGRAMRYQRPAHVYRGFRTHLAKFERLVSQTAREVYGRPPTQIVHLGTYNCRRIRGWSRLLSEHALGNAIDVAGFDFGPARGRPPAAGVPRAAFRVRLASHWSGKQKHAIHGRFLRRLDRRVREAGIFTVVLGPGSPAHHDHFHLDRGPSRARKVVGYLASFLGNP